MTRLSRRLRWSAEENPLSRALASRRAAGLPLIDLTGSDPTRAGLSPKEAELLPLLAPPGSAHHQPEPLGLPAARSAVAAHYLGCRGARIDPGRIWLAASTSEACGLLLKLLCDPGDCVLVPQPGYPLFEWLAALEGVRSVPWPWRWEGEWRPDLAALEAALAAEPRARAVLVVSPGNPTGAFLREGDRARLAALCRARGCALICDEVFGDGAPGGSVLGAGVPQAGAPGGGGPLAEQPVATAAAADDALSFSLGGLSKACGLPQLKLAWCAVAGPPAEVREALAGLELAADAYLSVATPVQLALPSLLALRPGFAARVRARCGANRAALAAARRPDSGWDLLPAEAGWCALLRAGSAGSDEALALALLARGVLLQPGYLFDLPEGFLVAGLLAPEEEVAAAAPVIARVLDAAPRSAAAAGAVAAGGRAQIDRS